jgi:Zn ribbon nucleic-acid-binding protein
MNTQIHCPKCLDKKVIVYGDETVSGQESVKCDCVDEKQDKQGEKKNA